MLLLICRNLENLEIEIKIMIINFNIFLLNFDILFDLYHDPYSLLISVEFTKSLPIVMIENLMQFEGKYLLEFIFFNICCICIYMNISYLLDIK